MKAIQDSTDPGAVVLDTFMGSGSTAVACLRTGRNYIGFELDEKYHAIATGRVAEEEAAIPERKRIGNEVAENFAAGFKGSTDAKEPESEEAEEDWLA